MATFQGTAGGGGRVPFVDVVVVSRSASQAVVRYTVRSTPVTSTWGTFTGTLTVNGTNYAISGGVSSGVANTIYSFEVTYKTAAAFTLNVSLTGGISGTSGWSSTSLSGSTGVAAGGTPPGAPSNFAITRTGDTTATLSFTKGSGATSTQLTASRDSGTYYELAEPTGSSQPVTHSLDAYYRFAAYSKNAVGSSGVIGPFHFYTKPKTPTQPQVADGRAVSWTLPARYKHGVQVERTDDGGATVTTYDLGAVTTWIDPVAQTPLTQYRVRSWAGPSLDEDKTYSDWSPWSESAMSLTYKPPQITKLDVRRCTAAGVLTETGTYLRVVSSGTASSVLDAGGTETNKLTRKVAYRKIGATTWVETTLLNQGAPNSWTNVAVTIGGGLIAETDAWEVRYTAQDAYTGAVVQQVTIPVSRVAFAMAGIGTSHGKIWERGALDVGGDGYFEGDLHVAGHLIEAHPDEIVIDGVAYPAGGVISRSVATTTSSPPGYVGNTTLAMPYTPPDGWFFHVVYMNTQSSSGYTAWLGYVTGAATASITCRIIGNISGTATGFFVWKLTKLP